MLNLTRWMMPLLLTGFVTLTAYGQEPESRPTPPQDLKPGQVRTADTTIKKIMEELQKVQDNDRQNTQIIGELTRGREIDNSTKYELIKSNLIYASDTYYLLNKKIIDLKSRTTTSNLDVFITSLNNPESKELGFSLSDRVVELVEKIILKGKSDKNERNTKLVESTKSIINSPIFKSFTSLTPPLAIASSVMNFLHSVSQSNKAINHQLLQQFEKELNKYVIYYTALNDANQKFEFGLNFNKDQLSLLQDNMYDHLAFTANVLKMPLPAKGNKTVAESLNDYFIDFRREKVTDFFTKMEEKYTKGKKIDYEKLLQENANLKEANNQLEDLVLQTKRFENLYNEYFSLLDTYYSKVSYSLRLAQDNGLAEKGIVDAKQNEFRQLKEEAVKEIQASINMRELLLNVEKIKYRYRIF